MIKGKRIKVPQLIEGRSVAGPFIVRVEVEAVIPDADPREPCFEPAVLRLLDEWQQMAEAGRIDELAKVGDVFVRRSA